MANRKIKEPFSADRLKTVLKLLKMKQKDLCDDDYIKLDRLKMDLHTAEMTPDNLTRIAERLNVSVDYLQGNYFEKEPFPDDSRKLYDPDGIYIPPFNHSAFFREWQKKHRTSEEKFWDWVNSTDIFECISKDYSSITGKEISAYELQKIFVHVSGKHAQYTWSEYPALKTAVTKAMFEILLWRKKEKKQ